MNETVPGLWARYVAKRNLNKDAVEPVSEEVIEHAAKIKQEQMDKGRALGAIKLKILSEEIDRSMNAGNN